MPVKSPNPDSIDKLISSRRILILGSSGSGKTFLSLRLGACLGLPVRHLDKYFWKPGWIPTPQSEWRKTVASLVTEPLWIIDGTYESTLDLRLPACETIIVVERGPFSSTWGVVRRKLTINDEHRPDAPPGQPIDYAFLRYIWRYPFVTRPHVYQRIQELAGEKHLIIVKGSRGINELISLVDKRASIFSPHTGYDITAAQTE
jgi:adenylate kinase family enzyme